MQDTVNAPNATEMLTLKRLVLWCTTLTSIVKMWAGGSMALDRARRFRLCSQACRPPMVAWVLADTGPANRRPGCPQGHRVLHFCSPQEGSGTPPALCRRRRWWRPGAPWPRDSGVCASQPPLSDYGGSCVPRGASCATPPPAPGVCARVRARVRVRAESLPGRLCHRSPRASEGSSVWAGPLLNQMLLCFGFLLPGTSPPQLRPLATCSSF